VSPLARLLARRIEATGPMPVAQWMALCLGHPEHGYYITRDPLGSDFTTAPEVSQVFGELIGAWFADQWVRAGAPARVLLVELGPGRGTLMGDLRRATARLTGFAAAAAVHFVETSPVFRSAQAARMPDAQWHATLAEVPDDAPLLLVANEFFDALPVRQFVRTAAGWRERLVGYDGGRFAPVAGSSPTEALVPGALWQAPIGSVVEVSAASTAIAAEIGSRLRAHGGAALTIDYGHAGPVTGDTLQAVRANAFADPFDTPGEVDLTAHVDFTALAVAAERAGVSAFGPVEQGNWLNAMGIRERTKALAGRATPGQAESLHAGAARLTAPNAMGSLFKVLALTGRDWPAPAGFAG